MLKVVYLQRIHFFGEKINYVMGYKKNLQSSAYWGHQSKTA